MACHNFITASDGDRQTQLEFSQGRRGKSTQVTKCVLQKVQKIRFPEDGPRRAPE